MSTIFPLSASVGQIFNGYQYNGTKWELIGIDLTADYPEIVAGKISASVIPDTFATVDYVDQEVGNIDLSPYLTTSSASSTYLTQSSASSTYATKVELNNIDLSSASTAAVAAIIDSAPATLDTLNELAAALNDDANFATTVTNSLANKWNAKISDTAPTSPSEGDVWVDTNGATTIPKYWDGSNWLNFSQGAPALTDADVSATTGSPTIVGPYTIADKSYISYIFKSGTNSITFSNDGTIDVLVVGGGGGGGASTDSADGFGGGGGGGVCYIENYYVLAKTCNIAIGDGGGMNAIGNASYFDNIVEIGGGPGGLASFNGGYGASGGGGGATTATRSGGAGLNRGSGGYDGGPSAIPSARQGGGGGGAGGTGYSGAAPSYGQGGIGLIANIITTTLATNNAVGEVSGTDVYFGGGGGGGSGTGGVNSTGGLGGGGNGKNRTSGAGENGAPNTGGGGGGSADLTTGSLGGSGVVIIRVRAS